MQSAHDIVLFELRGADDARFSPYCWRTRYALAHKGIAAHFEPVRFTEKAKIAASGHERVPVLRDGEAWIGDSWRIACHLEERFPAPPLFPEGRDRVRAFNDRVDRELHPLMLRAIVGELFERVDPLDRAYFRESRERRLGATIESVAARREEFVRALVPELDRLERALTGTPFLAGAAPAYADCVLAGTFEWVGRTSSLALPAAGSRLAGWLRRVREAYSGDVARG